MAATGSTTDASDKIGSYSLNYSSEIGRGCKTIVRNCLDLQTGIPYALKSAPLSETEIVNNMKNEAALLSKLDHPNIIKLHDTYQDKKYFHMVTELCTGGELCHRVMAKAKGEEQRYSERQVAKIIRQLVDAVAYCHQNDIVHRDIKITNILMKENTSNCTDIMLIDFGLATEYDENNSNGAMLQEPVGTTCYVAPEVLQGSYNSSCDIWAIGIITYILFRYQPPFLGANDAQTCELIQSPSVQVQFPRTHWNNTSNAAKDFIKSLLQKDPHLRPSINDLQNHPWLQETATTPPPRAPASITSTSVDNYYGCMTSFVKKLKKALKIKPKMSVMDVSLQGGV